MKINIITLLLIILGILSFQELEIITNSPYFYSDSGIIKCEDAKIGDRGRLNGNLYLAVDEKILRSMDPGEGGDDYTTFCVSHVTDMGYLFYNAHSFNQPIGYWDTSNVVNMGFMFYNAIDFNQPIGSWNTSNVENMELMFVNSSSFNQDLSGWNVDKVTDYRRYDCNTLVWDDSYKPFEPFGCDVLE